MCLQDVGFEMFLSLKVKWCLDLDVLELCCQYGCDIVCQWVFVLLLEIIQKIVLVEEIIICVVVDFGFKM